SRPSPANTTVRRMWLSSRVEDKSLSSASTLGTISCASSTMRRGRESEASMWDCQRSRKSLEPPQRLLGRSVTANRSPSSRYNAECGVIPRVIGGGVMNRNVCAVTYRNKLKTLQERHHVIVGPVTAALCWTNARLSNSPLLEPHVSVQVYVGRLR